MFGFLDSLFKDFLSTCGCENDKSNTVAQKRAQRSAQKTLELTRKVAQLQEPEDAQLQELEKAIKTMDSKLLNLRLAVVHNAICDLMEHLKDKTAFRKLVSVFALWKTINSDLRFFGIPLRCLHDGEEKRFIGFMQHIFKKIEGSLGEFCSLAVECCRAHPGFRLVLKHVAENDYVTADEAFNALCKDIQAQEPDTQAQEPDAQAQEPDAQEP